MVNNIVFCNNIIPPFHHGSIHLVHALNWTAEIGNSKLIVKMCVRSKECLHKKGPNGLSYSLVGGMTSGRFDATSAAVSGINIFLVSFCSKKITTSKFIIIQRDMKISVGKFAEVTKAPSVGSRKTVVNRLHAKLISHNQKLTSRPNSLNLDKPHPAKRNKTPIPQRTGLSSLFLPGPKIGEKNDQVWASPTTIVRMEII